MQAAIRRGAIFITGVLAASTLHPAVAAQSPSAEEQREPVEFTFRFSRADLATPRGAERAYRRLVIHAGKACTIALPGSFALRYKDEACVAGLVEKMVRQIDAAALTSRWQRNRPEQPSVQQPVTLR